MADNTIPQAEASAVDESENVESTTGNTGSDEVEELKQQLEVMEKRFKGVQKKLNETDREKSEIEKQNEEDRRAKMSELEKLREDVQRQQEETAKWMREARSKENSAKAKDFLHEHNLPLSMLDIVDTSSNEALDNSLNKIVDIAEEMKKGYAQQFASSNGQAGPKTGSGEAVRAPKSFKDAKTKDERIAYLRSQRSN